MSSIHNPHDAFFKNSMEEPLFRRQFLQQYLPAAVSEQLDYDSLEIDNNEYNNGPLQTAFSDVVFKCNLAGQEARLSILIEHQSSPDPFMPVRVGFYLFSLLMRQLKEKHTKLPAAYCMVFYHGKQYPYSLNLADCFDDPLGLMVNLFAKPIPMVDVNQLPDEQLRQQQLVGAFALALKHVRDANISQLVIDLISNHSRLQQHQKAELAFIALVLEYLFRAGNMNNDDWRVVFEHAQQQHNPIGDTVMTIADILREEGLKKGRMEGLEQGKLEGKLETARNLLSIGLPVEQIVQATGLTEAEVAELQTKH